MKRVYSLLLCSFALLLALISCQKSGTGPEGPKGDHGTANVIYSAWFTPSAWIKDTVFYVWGFNYTKTAPELTQNILDSGTVIIYGKLLGYNPQIWPAGQISQMPIVLNYKNTSGGITNTDTWSALPTAGKLKIRFVNDQNYYGSIATSHQFRYIAIPGGKAGGRMAALSYHEICEMYHIPE